MKLKNLSEKLRQAVRKIGPKTLIAICAVLVFGCAVTLNFILRDHDAAAPKLAVDLTSSTPPASTASKSDYFATVSLERKQARDEAMEVLKTVSESDTALEEARQAALDGINGLAMEIEREANIESLVQSKGFDPCVAVISEDKCSIVVESTGLLPGDVAQISEIVYEQAGILPENLKIIEKNSGT